jgi:hypothetical protein
MIDVSDGTNCPIVHTRRFISPRPPTSPLKSPLPLFHPLFLALLLFVWTPFFSSMMWMTWISNRSLLILTRCNAQRHLRILTPVKACQSFQSSPEIFTDSLGSIPTKFSSSNTDKITAKDSCVNLSLLVPVKSDNFQFEMVSLMHLYF